MVAAVSTGFSRRVLAQEAADVEMPVLWEGAANYRPSPTPLALKGELCARNNNTPIDDFSGMNWSCCTASASLAAAPRRACQLFDVPASSACQRAAMWRQSDQNRSIFDCYRFCSGRPGMVVVNGSRGRQKAARDKISTAFLEALNNAFEEPNSDGTSTKGLDAVKKVRDEDPATFARIYASLLPKQLEIEESTPESRLTD